MGSTQLVEGDLGTPALLHREPREVAGGQRWAVAQGAGLLPQSHGVATGCAFFLFFSARRDTTFPLDFLVHGKAFLQEPVTFSCVIILLNTMCSRVSFICEFLFRMCQATKLSLATTRKGGWGSHTRGPDVTMVELPLMDGYRRPS